MSPTHTTAKRSEAKTGAGNTEPAPVSLWTISLIASPQAHLKDLEVLTDEERARCARLIFERHRVRFARARRALRELLAHSLREIAGLELTASQISLTAEHRGKPCLAPEQRLIEFNLSHSHELALLAISQRGQLGVDLERVDERRDIEGLSRYAFSPREQAALAATAPAQRRAAFFRIWTRKEAYLKALGMGLHIPLESFEVTHEPEQALLLDARHEGAQPHLWTMHHLELGRPDYQAALVHDLGQAVTLRWRVFGELGLTTGE